MNLSSSCNRLIRFIVTNLGNELIIIRQIIDSNSLAAIEKIKYVCESNSNKICDDAGIAISWTDWALAGIVLGMPSVVYYNP